MTISNTILKQAAMVAATVLTWTVFAGSATAQQQETQPQQTPQAQRIISTPVVIVPPVAEKPQSTGKTENAEIKTPTKEELVTKFRKLVRQRDTLHAELAELENKALQSVKDGQNPVEIYAQQISTQEKLDLTSLRLEMLSLRVDKEIPPLPQNKTSENAGDQGQRSAGGSGIKQFNQAERRTYEKLTAQTMQMLQSLNMEAFLADDGRN